jgi:hypothetical protein
MDEIKMGLQVDDDGNRMEGLEGRCGLLLRLGEVLRSSGTFGSDDTTNDDNAGVKRPGNMVDKLVPPGSTNNNRFKVDQLWTIVMDDLGEVWPGTRTQLEGVGLGDAWVCQALKEEEQEEQEEAAGM